MDTGLWSLATSVVLRLFDHWFAVLPLVLLWAAVAGGLARGVGFSNLFRDDDHVVFVTTERGRLDRDRWRQRRPWLSTLSASAAFWSHLGLTVLGGLVWLGANDPMPGSVPSSDRTGLIIALAVVTAIGLGASALTLLRPRLDLAVALPEDLWRELARCLLGGVVGAAVVVGFHTAALWLAGLIADLPVGYWQRLGAWPMTWVYVLTLLAVTLAFTVPYLVAGLATVALAQAVVAVIHMIGAITGTHGELAAIALIVLLVWGNGAWFKGRIPGLAYPALAGDGETAVQPNRSQNLAPNPAKIPLTEPLAAWHARQGRKKPVLVLVATSGGAYRASFWTALVLDRIAAEAHPGGPFEGLPENIRLIAGASGGMVAGAYFTALSHRDRQPPKWLSDAISQDTVDYQRGQTAPDDGKHEDAVFRGRRRRIPIPRDSLSAVVQQFIRRDLLGAFVPGPRRIDRGVMLENQWLALRRSFASIAESERAGLCPSIVFTPMLVETGSVAFVSNLDLRAMRMTRLMPWQKRRNADRHINDHSVELFDAFPDARDTLTLATATRLNATFPYVSPALSLPTIPGRRVVDAGYYDNYGGDVIASWLATPEVMDWVSAHCSGVAVLQIRAFKTGTTLETPASRVARAFQGITSPPEGLFSARGNSQLLRNNQQLDLVERLYEERFAGKSEGRCTPFVQRFTFEAFADTTMSWYLPDGELESLRRLLPHHPDFSVAHAMDDRALRHKPGSRAEAQREEFEKTQAVLADELHRLAAFWRTGCGCG